ncbi:MAG TPA: hypothetical protein VL328_11145 [Gemmatimonadaceae bacterium]|jgi:hypothetical protein|nr:hypothetical protein [Gemmatimonadaceae bacterium]
MRPSLTRRATWARLAPLAVAVACATACATAGTPGTGAASTPTPSTQSSGSPLVQAAWPVRTREHVDLWLHAYALLAPDSMLVPYFERGYRDRMLALRRQRGVTTLLDSSRDRLLARIAVQPSLATSPQFLPFYFASWDQMQQVVSLFLQANGNPRATSEPGLQEAFAVLGASFQTAQDREWLRLFIEAVNDERRKFYHDYWTGEAARHAPVVAHVDSLWQGTWRPTFQRFLNNTQQQNGELYLALPLGGEGRTVNFGKVQNAVGVGMPDALKTSETVLYTFAHEVAGSVANAAIVDNTTPADRRSGATSRYEQSAAVRAGAVLLQHVMPNAVPGYMRFYLEAAGRAAPPDPRDAFTSTFAVPAAISDAIARQVEVILGGI